jgi:tetratricopeptide (TPR) repeat protein
MRCVGLFLALAVAAHAQSLVLKDGKVVAVGKDLRRQGDTLFTLVELSGATPGQPAMTGEVGYAVAQIARLNLPPPAFLKTVPDLLAQGKAAEALAQLDPSLANQVTFRDLPGSWWAETALLKLRALNQLGRESEVEPLAQQISTCAVNPDQPRAAQAQVAVALFRKGQHVRALPIAMAVLKESKEPETRAVANVVKGGCLMAKKDWEGALLAYLKLPVFCPSDKQLLAQALLGAGRAQFELSDLEAAKATLNELKKVCASSPEAEQADAELQKIQRREKALAEPK